VTTGQMISEYLRVAEQIYAPEELPQVRARIMEALTAGIREWFENATPLELLVFAALQRT
jgi:hypothetical protein